MTKTLGEILGSFFYLLGGYLDYYVYIHRQRDSGEVFYVGKGRGRRAWSTYSRSKFWKSKVEKHGVIVEIVLNNIQEWYAFELEQELILK